MWPQTATTKSSFLNRAPEKKSTLVVRDGNKKISKNRNWDKQCSSSSTVQTQASPSPHREQPPKQQHQELSPTEGSTNESADTHSQTKECGSDLQDTKHSGAEVNTRRGFLKEEEITLLKLAFYDITYCGHSRECTGVALDPDVISYCPITSVLKHIYYLQTYSGGESVL